MINTKFGSEEGFFTISPKWQFAIIWLSLSFFATLFVFQANNIESEKQLQTIERNQTQITTELFRTVEESFSKPISDIDFIERQLKTNSLSNNEIEKLFINLTSSRQLAYIQLRLIDLTGNEIVRIETHDKQVIAVAENEYQNKANRYYVQEALSLLPGQTFISPMDLNVEHDQIERPFKPTVRFARLITLHNGQKNILVINFDTSQMLNAFSRAESNHIGQNYWLINEQGFWYKASNSEFEWGHILNDRNMMNMSTHYPIVWKSIQQNNNPSFQAIIKGNLLSIERLSATSKFANSLNLKINKQDDFLIIGLVKKNQLSQMMTSKLTDKISQIIVLSILSALVALLIVRTNLHHREVRVRRIKQQKQIEAILENSPDAIFVLDESNKITFSNYQATTLFGYTQKSIITLNINSIFDDNANKVSSKFLSQAPLNQTFIAAKQDRTLITIAVNSNTITIDENELTLISMHDVTSQLELEKQLKQSLIEAELANEAKSEFLANMSHEIRSPLNGVIGMLSILNDEESISAQQKVLVNQASASAKLLLRVINDILDISKINTSVLTLENHPFDLENLLKDIGRTMSPISEAKKIELLCPANVSQNYELLGDEGRIKQILLNLISNAIKFTDIGHISVSVDTVRDHNHCILQFSIRDTGIGIPQSKVEHVFERFTQVDGSITRSAGGTGLGLAICSELINLMKGEISVTSALGQGSCFNFHIRLPIVSDLTLEKYDIDSALNIICMISNDALADTIVSFTESWGIKTFRLPNYSDLSSLLATKNPDDKLTLISDHGFLTGMSEQVESEQISLFNGIIFISSLLESMTPLNLPVTTLAMIKPIIPSELFNNILGLARKADSTHIVNKHLDKNTLAPLSAKLLLVEDDIINLKVAENILRKKGAEIITAMNGQEAIEALKSDTFDVVLMDCHMPIMDGYAATEAIRKGIAGQQNKDIPIIALTANAIAGEDERCFASGMSDYISKPFETSELINCIQKWLNR